jgi:hypothetical protein
MMRPVIWFCTVSMRSRSCGYSGVSFANSGRPFAFSGSSPLTESRRTSGLNFSLRSPSRWVRIAPVITSPRRRP